jgi:tetratricopeptide (TPR) repeat protein
MEPSPDPTPRERGSRLLAALALAAITLGVFASAGGHEFVNLDDPSYVHRNEVVREGLSLDGLAYALRGGHSTNWHPLTTLSHMLDVELFGLDAGKHHLTSVVLHALNAALCFLAFLALTGRRWTSLLIAALFALHPLRVESVAWISERKDVLSGTFFFLTLLAWVRHLRAPSSGRYALVMLCLALGLMSKQMLVTLPFLLVLLDVWPLGRWAGTAKDAGRTLRALLLEKVPLIALGLAALLPMWLAQSAGATIGSLGALPLVDRLANAFNGYLAYARLTLVPTGLACFYPHPSLIPGERFQTLWLPALLGLAFVALVTFFVLRRLRRTPALAVGWFWYLGTLVPVIGVVQIGSQAYADRYTYLSTIGLVVLVLALVEDLLRTRATLRTPAVCLALLALGVYSAGTVRQLGYWADSETLNQRALEVTEFNYVAHNNLGLVQLEELSDPVSAEIEFQRALEINPFFRQAAYNLAIAYIGQGMAQKAELTLQALLQMDPGFIEARTKLAEIQRAKGNTAEALASWKAITEENPDDVRAWLELGRLHLASGEGIHAEACAERAIELDDSLAEAHILHGRAARLLNYPGATRQRFARAVEADPAHPEARVMLGRELAGAGELDAARDELEVAVQLDGANPEARILLAKIALAGGDEPAARGELDAALKLRPGHPEGNDLLGNILLGNREFAAAEEAFQAALETNPTYDAALHNLGALYEQTRREAEALEQYTLLLDTDPDSPFSVGAARGRAWILATSPDPALRDGSEAVRWSQFVLSRTDAADPDPAPLIVLAAALAEDGRFEDALQVQTEAIARARNEAQKKGLEKRLELFRAGEAFHRTR